MDHRQVFLARHFRVTTVNRQRMVPISYSKNMLRSRKSFVCGYALLGMGQPAWALHFYLERGCSRRPGLATARSHIPRPTAVDWLTPANQSLPTESDAAATEWMRNMGGDAVQKEGGGLPTVLVFHHGNAELALLGYFK